MARACAAAGGEKLLRMLPLQLKVSQPSPNSLYPSTQIQGTPCLAVNLLCSEERFPWDSSSIVIHFQFLQNQQGFRYHL